MVQAGVRVGDLVSPRAERAFIDVGLDRVPKKHHVEDGPENTGRGTGKQGDTRRTDGGKRGSQLPNQPFGAQIEREIRRGMEGLSQETCSAFLLTKPLSQLRAL